MAHYPNSNIMTAAQWLATASREERGALPAAELLRELFGMTDDDAEMAARQARLLRARAH